MLNVLNIISSGAIRANFSLTKFLASLYMQGIVARLKINDKTLRAMSFSPNMFIQKCNR